MMRCIGSMSDSKDSTSLGYLYYLFLCVCGGGGGGGVCWLRVGWLLLSPHGGYG